jgi:hypothetical protein
LNRCIFRPRRRLAAWFSADPVFGRLSVISDRPNQQSVTLYPNAAESTER